MDQNTLRLCPHDIRTARTVLRLPNVLQVPVRQAWAQANLAQLDFVAWWRRSVDEETATRSANSEIMSVATGTEVIFNVFMCDPACDVAAAYACGPYVGRIDLHSWDFDVPRCEIGYMADVRTQGTGLLREACGAAIELAFALGAVRVQAVTDTRNFKSIRFAKALGLQAEGVLRNYERDASGRLCDQQLLAITAPDHSGNAVSTNQSE
jgi:RimJ/RimL family protein N-acetyltransferase